MKLVLNLDMSNLQGWLFTQTVTTYATTYKPGHLEKLILALSHAAGVQPYLVPAADELQF